MSTKDLTLQEAAAELRLSTDTLRRWVLKGDLPAYRVGEQRRIRIRQEDLTRVAIDRDLSASGSTAA